MGRLFIGTQNINDNIIKIKYFPNPTDGLVNILYDGDIITSVIDLNGRKILESNEKIIDLTGFEKGTYVLKIIDKLSQKINFIKIIKN